MAMTHTRIAALILVGLVGCSGSSESDATSTVDFDEITLNVDPGTDAGGRALKEEVFSDGVVTFDEYERAMNAYAQCVRDEGFEVRGPLSYPADDGTVAGFGPGEDPRDLLNVWFPGVFDAAESDRLSNVDLRCQEQWSYAIQFIWREQNRATGVELQEWLERAWECARQRGTVLSDPPTEIEAMMSANDGHFDGCVPWE